MTYKIIRKKVGNKWNLNDNEPRIALIFQSSDKQEAEQFLKDDIEDMRNKWPELGKDVAGAGWIHGSVMYRHLGTEDFGLVYMFDTSD